jgi:hypothetical protein
MIKTCAVSRQSKCLELLFADARFNLHDFTSAFLSLCAKSSKEPVEEMLKLQGFTPPFEHAIRIATNHRHSEILDLLRTDPRSVNRGAESKT